MRRFRGGGLWAPGHSLWPKTTNKIIRIINYVNCVIFKYILLFRHTKIYLRSTIGQYRLNGLMLLNTHKNIKITPKKVVEVFSKRHSRKLLT